MITPESTPGDAPILIVDDDLAIREALSDVLEDRGFAVVTAANGVDALTLLRNGKVSPWVILLDLMMPIMDGYGFLAEQRRDPALAPIPVAIITAGHGVDHSRLNGSVALVAKPIKMPQLVGLLQQLRSHPRTRT